VLRNIAHGIGKSVINLSSGAPSALGVRREA